MLDRGTAIFIAIPMPRIYFEDFVPGTVTNFGPRTITREEIIAFASEFDPQPMHLYDGFLVDAASMGAPGIDEVKWLKPVRPGDSLSVRLTALEKREPKTRPDMGFVQFRCELLNQNGEVVLDS